MSKSSFACFASTTSTEISLCAPSELQVNISLLGASICGIYTKDRYGHLDNIVFTSQNAQDYAGATLGPVAGRIKNAYLPINNVNLPLTANDGANTLHGGTQSLSHQLWQIQSMGCSKHSAFIELHCRLAHGVDGFPGNRWFSVRYVLTQKALTVFYRASTDKTTFVNMSNHTYWNLSGDFSQNCYNQQLELCANAVMYNDEQHLPLFTQSPKGTAFDFSVPTRIQSNILQASSDNLTTDAGQLTNAHGYNNGFALTRFAPFAARLSDDFSGRRMTLFTNQPWLVMYSGGYLPVCGCALALEAQGKPCSVTPLLNPGQAYCRTIRFAFDYI